MLFTQSVFAGGEGCSFGCGSNFRHKRETRLLAVLVSLLLATSVMNVSLLLRCGDVEANPGPGRYSDLDYNSVDCSKVLGEDDLCGIMSEIITAKARFYAIGRALGLPPGELNSIRLSAAQDHELQLNDVLLLWLHQKYNVGKFGSPTWQKLVETIDNPAGGNDHRLAKTIALRHPVVPTSEIGCGRGCGHGQGHGYDRGSRGHGRGRGIESAGIPQAVGNQKEPPQTESKFEYRQTLANFYLRQIDDQAWPPVKMTNFIDLALIKDHKSWRKTVQGSVDEIVGRKESITYQQICDSLIQLKFILFEGRPGSGKTTLVTKISRDWANGLFLESKLLFLIPLRRLNAFDQRSLATLIQVACPPFKRDEIMSLERAVQTMNGKNVVFIFDGFDEYSPVGNDIVLNLMDSYRNFLREALIVVSSRPVTCQVYRERVDKQIEVVGFSKEHIIHYIQHYYSSDIEKAQQLLRHLEQHPNLMNMCYLPLHCAMLVFLYDGTTILPKTETEFYKHFTISTLLRSFRKYKNSVICLTSFDQIPTKDKILFDKVCKLAFEATVANKQVFKLSELQEMSLESGSMGSNENCLGLVVVDRYFMRFGLDETYTFLHLTFQEFLAAVHMAGLHPLEQVSIIKQHQLQLEVVYRFLCGMLNFTFPDALEIFRTMQACSNVSKLILIKWAHESQSQPLYDYLCEIWNGYIHLKEYHDTFQRWNAPQNIPSLVSLLNYQKFHMAVVNSTFFSKESIIAIFDSVDNKALHVVIKIDGYVDFFNYKNKESPVVQVKGYLTLHQFFETRVGSLAVSLKLYREPITKLKLCFEYPRCPVCFEVDGQELSEDAVQYLRMCTSNLDKLSPFKVFGDVVITVCNDLEIDFTNYTVKGLQIPRYYSAKSHFSPEDYARSLCDALQHTTNLREIRLFCREVSEGTMLILMDRLKHCTNLSLIDLGATKLNASGAQVLGQSLKHCNEVKILLLDENNIGDAGLEALMPGLRSCTYLETLALHYNKFTDGSVPHLVKLIQSNKYLKRLGCHGNGFTEVGRCKLKETTLEAGVYLY